MPNLCLRLTQIATHHEAERADLANQMTASSLPNLFPGAPNNRGQLVTKRPRRDSVLAGEFRRVSSFVRCGN